MTTRWQPSAPIENLQQRSEILWKIREFFRQREIFEVQTPVVGSNTVTDSNIESERLENGYFLQTSPEYFLKRLLAAGMPSCYQLGPVFRKGEVGRWHNPEFTMLEWYRPWIYDIRIASGGYGITRFSFGSKRCKRVHIPRLPV